MNTYLQAASGEDYEAAKALFREYAIAINVNLGFQHFDEELDRLQEMYAAPQGGIILCKQDKEWIGCVAVRKIDDRTGELKRMYVKPGFQNTGIGKALLSHALELARECGYEKIRLDTLNYMKPAIQLYQQAGFYEIAPYYYNPNDTAVFFEIKL
jgi:ribosomal protein S18 acetylase RimI-like enzyme